MSVGFPSEFKETVRSRTDLVSLVGESVILTPLRGGSDYVGLCPFHDDHTPSFHVYPDRQSWRCWVCNEGGDCFSFVEKTDGVPFFDALKSLAERANIPIPRNAGGARRDSGQATERDQMFAALKWAEERLHDCLMNSAEAREAREYFANRGFSAETMKTFRLGYHPDDWEWLLRQARGKFGLDILLKARIAGENKYGKTNDSHIFIDRVIFPIHDAKGRTISFGGRLLPGREGPKYYNGNESDLFRKSDVLYAFPQAKDAIRRSRQAIVVEGYTDCIGTHIAGLQNVVGVLGTALTESHVSLLKHLADEIILLFDGDAAGQLNADRVVGKFLAQSVDVKILTLPDNLDPAEFIEAQGVDALQTALRTSLEAWEFKYRHLLEKHGTDTIGSRQSILDEMLALMGQAPNLAGTVREDFLIARLSQRLLLAEKTVRSRLREIRSKKAPAAPGGTPPAETTEFDRLLAGKLTRHEMHEVDILEILLTNPERTGELQRRLSVEMFENAALRELFQFCGDLYERGRLPDSTTLLAELEDADQKRLVVVLDDWSRDKRIQEKLAELDTQTNLPVFLVRALENMEWRQEESKHEQTRGEIAGYTSSGGAISDKDRDLLRQAVVHHQRRFQKKPAI